MTFEEVTERLIDLARERGGTVTAADAEADELLSGDRDLTSAAARALAGSTNVFSFDEDDDREWFPYSGLTFSTLGS